MIAGASKPSQPETNVPAGDVELPQDAFDEAERALDYHHFCRRVW